jgi:hypothetical protein
MKTRFSEPAERKSGNENDSHAFVKVQTSLRLKIVINDWGSLIFKVHVSNYKVFKVLPKISQTFKCRWCVNQKVYPEI